jgi:hypothetical protein
MLYKDDIVGYLNHLGEVSYKIIQSGIEEIHIHTDEMVTLKVQLKTHDCGGVRQFYMRMNEDGYSYINIVLVKDDVYYLAESDNNGIGKSIDKSVVLDKIIEFGSSYSKSTRRYFTLSKLLN